MVKKSDTNQAKTDDTIYCRKCQNYKKPYEFYEATNLFLDTNGKMSLCRGCCQELYDYYYKIYGTLEGAMKATCRDLDVRFSMPILQQVQSQVDTLTSRGKEAKAIFGYYKSKLGSTGKANEGLDSFRFRDSDNLQDVSIGTTTGEIGEPNVDDMIFWGQGFIETDYMFLNSELENWKATHKCDNQAELTLLKEICIKILTIRNKRAVKENVSSEVKELQDLFKTASVDPAKANVASAGKSHEAFGVWIKDVEQFRPAEWFEQQEKYVDMDGFKPYIQNYVVRPIKNFISGVRNFFVNDSIDADLSQPDDGGENNV
ncbi:MAG: hypothetical protein M0P69_15740 [Bacteroidales bacterium]|nr:hypothetical protein [Bacteroidales bacterium]